VFSCNELRLGPQVLKDLPFLEALDLSHTEVHVLLAVTSLSRLDMSACNLRLGGGEQKLALKELHLSSAAFTDGLLLQARVTASRLTKLLMRDVRGFLPDLQFLSAAQQLQHLDLHGGW
jgi:hypothetical protein